jgi:acyl-ACP thioesterase
MTDNKLKYSKAYSVKVYETGSNGLLSVQSLFNYFQDIASEHATKLRFGRDDLMKANRFWVLSRIYAVIERWPLWEENIVVTTWPRGTERLFALRDYTAVSEKGDLIAAATSSWLVVDRTTMRVQKPESLLSYIINDLSNERSTGRDAEKIIIPHSEPEQSDPFRVVASCLDVNMHVNNTNYIKWVTDSFSPEFLKQYMPASVELNFLAESKYNDELFVSNWGLNQEKVSHHSVSRLSDRVAVCTATIKWRETGI